MALEKARAINTVVLDKTGTLTSGRMSVLAVEATDGTSQEELLQVAAAVEAGSEHPIAQAVLERVGEHPVVATGFETIPGHGIRAVIDGAEVHVGSARILAAQGLERPDSASQVIGSEVFVVREGVVLGRIVVGDELKDDARLVVERLRALGLTPVLLTGDNRRAADHVAAQVGITDVRAEVLPQEKAAAIKELQAEGRNVAMVGDGVNDAAALAQADLGIAMGAGTDAAIAASDITLMRDDLVSVVDAVRLSRATDRNIRTNLMWAFAYNVLAIPIAAAGLLTPMIAGAAMAFSSVFVVLNSLRLRLFRSERRST